MSGRLLFFFARLMPALLGVATTAFLTRVLEPAAYGRYALGLSIVFFLTIGTFEWLGLSLLRMAPTTKEPDLFFGTVMTCFTAMFAGSCIIAALVLIIGGLGAYAELTLSCLAAAFASAWVELMQRLQMAELRERDYFRMSVVRGILSTTFVCSAAYFIEDAPAILFALALSLLITALVGRDRRLRFSRFRFDGAMFRKLLRFGLPLSVSVGLATILMSVDRWLLGLLSGTQDIGLFAAATLVAQVPVMTLANAIGPSAYSMVLQALEFRSREAALVQLEQNLIVLLGIILPAAFGITALSTNMAHVLLGQAYWESVVQLAPWVTATAVLASVRAFYIDTAFQIAHHTSPLVWTMLLSLFVNLGLDFWLIPTWGTLGAAIGSFTALLVGLIVASVLSRRAFPLPAPVFDITKVLVSSVIMFATLRASNGYFGPMALFCQVAGGGLLYGALLFLFNVLGARTSMTAYMPQVRRVILGNRRAAP